MMDYLLTRIDLFHACIADDRLEAAKACKRLIDRRAADLELKVWRYASRLIMQGEV